MGISMALRYNSSVCGRLINGIAGSNPANVVDVRLSCYCVLCRKRALRQVDHTFYLVCVCVCLCVFVRR